MTIALRPQPTPTDPQQLHTLQQQRERSAIGWLLAGVFTAHLTGLVIPWEADPAATAAFGILTLLSLGMLAAGAAQLVLLARAESRRRAAAAGYGLAAALGAALAPLAGLLLFAAGILQFAVPLAVLIVGAVLLPAGGRTRSRPRAFWATASGLAVGFAALAGILLDTLVLLPLQLSPGLPLPEVYSALARAQEDSGVVMPIIFVGLWAPAMLTLAFGSLRGRRSPETTLGLLLGASALALFSLPVAQFSLGMGLADTFFGGGGVTTAFPWLLAAAGLLAACSAGLLIRASRTVA